VYVLDDVVEERAVLLKEAMEKSSSVHVQVGSITLASVNHDLPCLA
jgi:hypothetical protein